MSLKILAVGDVHLGKLPLRLPGELRARAAEAGPAGAWERLTDYALKSGIHAVVFCGDLVEGDQDFFEAGRILHRGVARMAEGGIRVLGVAGNHDVTVLPRLVKQVPGFELLGEGGIWQSVKLGEGPHEATLWGWSFPRPSFRESPLKDFPFEAGKTGLHIGVLHCDRDQGDSPFAPVSSQELRLAGPDVWLLGHIHKPDPLSLENTMGYLGSLSGTDPGEPGIHGPWLLSVKGQSLASIEQIPLATMQWESLVVDCSKADSFEEIQEQLLARIHALDESIRQRDWPPLAVGLRVIYEGTSSLSRELLRQVPEESSRDHVFSGGGGTHYFVEKVVVNTCPAWSLRDLARGAHPPGLLAKRLLLLEQPEGDPERVKLLEAAKAEVLSLKKDSRWGGMPLPEPSSKDLATHLRLAGMKLLEQLMNQKREAP